MRTHLRKMLLTLASVGAIGAGGLMVASPASAATSTPQAVTCGPYSTIQTSGGYARYRECYDGSTVRVNGWVTDTDADGQCARVYASYNIYQGIDYSANACPEGETEYFTFPWRAGTNAYVYLQEINA
ncbi:hypothetical protein [Georgenia yuyongxinii]